ncbi:helix-turn-helix domain-containing protein [Rhodobacterales bacterium HKCCE4037]|nr:helix-turn-helix domain-containing protein [Rhodobacterales bacterium HKCCE4037]
MADGQYTLKTVDRAFQLLRIVMDAPAPLSLSEIAVAADTSTSNAFRFLKTLEASGHVVRDSAKRYAAVSGGGGEIGLNRGVAILDLIAAAPGGALSSEDLASAIGVDVPQVERALEKLRARSVVERSDGAWVLSPGMMRFFRPLLNDQFLSRFIRPLMVELSETFGETVSWFVPHGWEQVVVEVLPSPHPIRFVLETGARQPAYLGAAGKAHLATLDPDAVAAFLRDLEPIQLTRFKLETEALLDELTAIRARGYATSDGERVEGAASVAVAIRGPDGQVVGVISVMMPKFRKSAADLRSIGETLKARVAALFDRGEEETPLREETK